VQKNIVPLSLLIKKGFSKCAVFCGICGSDIAGDRRQARNPGQADLDKNSNVYRFPPTTSTAMSSGLEKKHFRPVAEGVLLCVYRFDINN
jgi:hypothetical protein